MSIFLTDRTSTIRASVNDVQFELMLAIALAVVIYLFYANCHLNTGHCRTAVARWYLCSHVFLWFFCPYGVNHRHRFCGRWCNSGDWKYFRYLEKGDKLVAALKGAGERFTIISLTFSLVAVLIRCYLWGYCRPLFREFAITLAVAILISAVVSLTLTPMMCARLLKPESQHKHNRFELACERFFDRMVAGYAIWLKRILNHQWLTLSVALGTMVLFCCICGSQRVFPVADSGIIQGSIESRQSISFAAMAQKQQEVASKLLADLRLIMYYLCGRWWQQPNIKQCASPNYLKALDEREDRVVAIIDRHSPG